MPFLAAQIFLAYALLGMFFKAASQTGMRPSLRLFAVFVTMAVIGLALFLSLLQPVVDDRHGVAMDAFNWCVPVYLVSGVLSVLVFGHRLFGLTQAKGVSGELRLGVAVIGVLAGAFTIFAAADHLFFMRGDKNKVGVMDAILVADAKLPKECGHVVLVRLEEGTMVYRCPTVFVLGGRFRSLPFAPWPSYVSGESPKARAIFDEVMRSASDTTSTGSHTNGQPSQ
ncbi:hypothetical protein EON83_29575 [bacterium]|nr:MAG: hypothetical protein EON83_29575 [bacterium]